jgi:hypothetical protein
MATGEPQVFDFTEDDDDDAERPNKPFTVRYRRREYETVEGETDESGEPKRVPTGRWLPTEEKFEAKGQIPAGLSLNTIAAFGTSGAAASNAIIQFLHRCLIDGDNVRFLTLIEDDDTRFQMRNLSKVVDWLLTEYGERPTKSA